MSKAYTTITGRLARDPETRTTGNGTTLTRLTIPTETGWGDRKATTWWSCTIFGKSAEAAAKFLSKGQWVTLTGPAGVRTYDKNDGTTGFSAEIEVKDWGFCGNKSDNAPASDTRSSAPSSARSAPSQTTAFADDDIPF